ncbi:hypothetical protein BX600DRAFT_438358 [Xylariales sp. PMI_506]|nr:hypothetical protein BX600DRAFT_438358 [Xylariales sp. PMI_506]
MAISLGYSNHTTAWFDHQLGRRPSQAPSYLSRILYIPHHDSNTAHLPIYEVGDRYRNAIQDALIGSTTYTTRLGSMKTPSGGHMTDQVAYLADMQNAGANALHVCLGKREMGMNSSDLEITMPLSSADEIPAVTIRSGRMMMKLCPSFPIPNSTIANKIIKHPYFTLDVLDMSSGMPTNLEWRLDPKDGLLRYTLVQKGEEFGETVCAIYHHRHWELSLCLPYSEGVLLLPQSQQSSEIEGIVVASLLGMLAHLRSLSASEANGHQRGRIERIKRLVTIRFSNHRI